jgi:hypothetical protein
VREGVRGEEKKVLPLRCGVNNTHLREGIAIEDTAIIMTSTRPYCRRSYGLRASAESPSCMLKVPRRKGGKEGGR